MAGIKNKDILKCIGVKVQEARRNKNYTQEFVAEKVDRSIDTIRVVLPIDFRNKLCMKEKDDVNIYMKGSYIVIEKPED